MTLEECVTTEYIGIDGDHLLLLNLRSKNMLFGVFIHLSLLGSKGSKYVYSAFTVGNV